MSEIPALKPMRGFHATSEPLKGFQTTIKEATVNNTKTLFEQDGHHWVAFRRGKTAQEAQTGTNGYLVVREGRGMLLDPGRVDNFPVSMVSVSEAMKLEGMEILLATHYDPDVVASLSFWIKLCPQAKVHVPAISRQLLTLFCAPEKIEEIPDGGVDFSLGGTPMQLIPAHYCHSPVNFSLFDPLARVLYSGNIGSVEQVNTTPESVFLKDFDRYRVQLENFHTRWLPSNRAKNKWVRQVRALDPEMICPIMGQIITRKDIPRFLNWLEELEVGLAA